MNKKTAALVIGLVVLIPLLIIFAVVPLRGGNSMMITVYRSASGELSLLSPTEQTVQPTEPPVTALPIEQSGELRAVWFAYTDYSDGLNKAKIDAMLDKCVDSGMNTVIFQVRPFADAMYDSEYYPWSHFASGKQGAAPANGFDPLGYMVEQAHLRSLEIHAWVNPLRIQLEGGMTPSELSENNPYNLFRSDSDSGNDHYVVDYNNGKYFNIGEAQIRELIVNGIAEIAAKYDVDGIHWDDYFYPAHDEGFDDSISYQSYAAAGGKLSLSEWRTQNVNLLVRDSYKAVKAVRPDCRFGISTAGNIANCLKYGADVYEWCSSEGYLDYICPQIYWSYEYEKAPFEQRCSEWQQLIKNSSIDFYIGLALYKAGTANADEGTWLGQNDILARELVHLRSIGADGFMLFSYRFLDCEQTRYEMANFKALLQEEV